jgi:uncharacterized protein
MIQLSDILQLCGFAFLAGFIDSIVGGGGLVQTPAMLFTLPQFPIPTLFGTTKIPSIVGSLTGAYQYAQRVKLQLPLLLGIAALAFAASAMGSYTLTLVPNTFMKPFALMILIVVFLYTFLKKDFGQLAQSQIHERIQWRNGLSMALLIGFYDGFFGPGAGSFLVLGFITLIGFDFLKASAHAKLVNVATNLGSVCFFVAKGHVLFEVALPMCFANASGAYLGAKTAILKGNGFIRIFFLCVVAATILRFGYDIFLK